MSSPDRHWRVGFSHACGLSWLQRDFVCPGCRAGCRILHRSGSGRTDVLQRLHGEDGRFVKNYFPVFMLGAVFGKVIELSGFSKSIVSAVIGVLGRERAVCRSSWSARSLPTAASHCSWLCSRSTRSRPRCSARAGFRSGSSPARLRSAHSASRWMPCRAPADPEHHSHDVLPDDDLGRPLARPDRQRVRSRSRSRLYREPPPCRTGARGRLRHQSAERARALRGREIAQSLDRPFAARGAWVSQTLLLTHAILRGYGDERTKSRSAAQADRYQDLLGGGHLGGGGRAAPRHPDGVCVCLAAGGREIRGRQQGGGCRSPAGVAQYRFRVRFRRRDRAVAGLCDDYRRAESDPQSAHQ